MEIDPSEKMCGKGTIEKKVWIVMPFFGLKKKSPFRIRVFCRRPQILRQAFDDKEDPYLPSEVLWRQKEQFSDGVGYGWYLLLCCTYVLLNTNFFFLLTFFCQTNAFKNCVKSLCVKSIKLMYLESNIFQDRRPARPR